MGAPNARANVRAPPLGHVNKIHCFSSFCLQKFGEGEAIYYLYLEVKGQMRLFYRCETGI